MFHSYRPWFSLFSGSTFFCDGELVTGPLSPRVSRLIAIYVRLYLFYEINPDTKKKKTIISHKSCRTFLGAISNTARIIIYIFWNVPTCYRYAFLHHLGGCILRGVSNETFCYQEHFIIFAGAFHCTWQFIQVIRPLVSKVLRSSKPLQNFRQSIPGLW